MSDPDAAKAAFREWFTNGHPDTDGGRLALSSPLAAVALTNFRAGWDLAQEADSHDDDPRGCNYQDGYNAGQDEAYERGRAAERQLVRQLGRRYRALESLLVCYRLSKRPTEKLFRELETTKADADALVADLLDGDGDA